MVYGKGQSGNPGKAQQAKWTRRKGTKDFVPYKAKRSVSIYSPDAATYQRCLLSEIILFAFVV